MPTLTVSPTPNPNSLKITVADATLIDAGMESYASASDAEDSAIGSALFAIPGVDNVFVTPGFLTVTKHPAADWDLLLEKVERVVEDYLEQER